MKSFVLLSVLTASALADTATFTNTSFANPLSVGQSVPLTWTTGKGASISLSIVNSTWASPKIFAGRTVTPASYDWTVPDVPGMVSGSYSLLLEQDDSGEMSLSATFQYIAPDNSLTTIHPVYTPIPVAVSPKYTPSSTTVTHVYWDHQCGCTKTTTATVAMNTGMPGTTTIWWDDRCGCHKSAVVPVSTIPASNNYTIPSAPHMATASITTSLPVVPTSAGNVAPTKFAGGAARFENSAFGMLALVAVAVFA